MPEIDVKIWYWTAGGMTSSAAKAAYSTATRYVEASEVERLLEEAHARGYQQGYFQGKKDERCKHTS